MNVLFIGDIMGEPGRRAISRLLPKVVTQHAVDLVIGNGENVAGGFGITPELAQELFEMGLSVITTGNHAWDKKEILDFIRREPRLLRPANYPSGVPGQGSIVVETPAGERLAVLQLMGRVFMPTLDCPFQVARREVTRRRRRRRWRWAISWMGRCQQWSVLILMFRPQMNRFCPKGPPTSLTSE
jgi:calcineurin-like phosphoesterase